MDPTTTSAAPRLGEEILDKVRKILAKAEDPAATAEEAETYTAKAAELVAAYGIDAARLAERGGHPDAVGSRLVVLDAPYALDKSGLLSGVASALRCQAVQRTRYVDGSKEISMHLFGFESDLLRAEVLYTSLLLQATTSVARTSAPSGESLAAYRRSWLAGFTGAVVSRLRGTEEGARRLAEEEPQDGRPVSLVLADRSVAVRAAVEQEYPRLRRGQSRSLSGSGGMSGYRAGERADLDGTRVGPPVRRGVGGPTSR